MYRRFCTWDATDAVAIGPVFNKIHDWDIHIQDISILYWKPASDISIDEAMVCFTGKSSDTVHIPSKPIPVGYKAWVLADSGYFLRWAFHSKGVGPIGYNSEDYPTLAPTQGIVAHLLTQIPCPPSKLHGYHVYMDNLFTTPELLQLLCDRGITATGTTRAGRVDSCQLADIKATETKKDSIPWGTLYARQHKEFDIMQFGFKDNAFVLLLSTQFDGQEDPEMKLHHQPAKTSTSAKTAQVPFEGQPEKVLPIPQIIDLYNCHMNGVDIGNQLHAGFQYERRI